MPPEAAAVISSGVCCGCVHIAIPAIRNTSPRPSASVPFAVMKNCRSRYVMPNQSDALRRLYVSSSGLYLNAAPQNNQ